MTRRIKVLALQRESHVAPGVPSLSVAARVTEVLDYLDHQGLVDYTSISETDPAAVNGVRWADAVIFSKHASREALELARLARQTGTRLLYDIDDWIFSFPSYSGGARQNSKSELIRQILDLSDAVTVANRRLQEKMREHVPVSFLVPNGMWVEKYTHGLRPIESHMEREGRIVFTNADFLKLQTSKDVLLTALQVFFLKNPQFTLDFYGDPFPEIVSLPFLHFTNRMPYDMYMQSLISGRYMFSIVPLGAAEDKLAAEFNACKNPFKYLNYGAAGVPGIYSASPIYTDCVQQKQTGLLIENTLDEWLEALDAMAFDATLRARIRVQSHDDILRHHHIRFSADALMTMLTAPK